MTYPDAILAQIKQLRRIGYSEEHIGEMIALYGGSSLPWREFSANQQRRLAADLGRYSRLARKWHYELTGCLK